ncbi:MAG: DUF559 domain-containing protein [Propionibacteriaceae bacterium]
MNEIEYRLRASGGALLRRSHADISGYIDRQLRNGTLATVLPGVYCASGDIDNLYVRLRAATLWGGPDAIITGQAAANLTFWPKCPVEQITLAVPQRGKRLVSTTPGFEVERRNVPEWLVLQRRRVRVTAPALTAVDLAGGPDRGNAIDQVLRTRSATLSEMWDAFRAQPSRPGNKQRRQVLVDSRDEPWSEAERLQHALLHDAHITGWGANRWIRCGDDGYYVDVLFRTQRLILEIDGWETHGTRSAFEDDRKRRNYLELSGYRVLNFTWKQLTEEPDWVLWCIRKALAR